MIRDLLIEWGVDATLIEVTTESRNTIENACEMVTLRRRSPGHTGFYHAAFLHPDRASLAAALRRVMAAGIEVTGAYDHGLSQSVYFNDPDGNGVEIDYDRGTGGMAPRRRWPAGHLRRPVRAGHTAVGRSPNLSERIRVHLYCVVADGVGADQGAA